MAYNQEYPNYLDTQLYNNDWLLHQYKGLTEDVSNLKTESTQNAADIAALQTITASNTTRIAALEQGGGGEPSDLAERVETLEGEVEDLKADMSEAQTNISSNTSRIGDLETDVSGIKQEQIVQDTVSADLRADLTKMSATLSAFTATVTSQGQAITSLQQAQTAQDSVNTELNERITDLENASGGEVRDIIFDTISANGSRTVLTIPNLDDYKAFIFAIGGSNAYTEWRVNLPPLGSSWSNSISKIVLIRTSQPISSSPVFLIKEVDIGSTPGTIVITSTYAITWGGSATPSESVTEGILYRAWGVKK